MREERALWSEHLNALLAILAAAEVLGPPVRQEAFVMRPPSAFRMARMDLFHLSRVGAVARSEEAPRRLLAAFVDTEGEDSAPCCSRRSTSRSR